MIDKSLKPDIAIFIVLGIGVADNVRTFTSVLNFFIFSLWVTPNRCSSSTINKPNLLNLTSSLKSLCVPKTISMVPLARPSSILLVSFGEVNRFKRAISTG